MELRQVTKECIVRIYGAPLDGLKVAVRKIASINGVTPQLFGKDNEYIVQISAQSGGEAAATEMCENASSILENTLGDDVYGRGEGTLAHVVAGALIAQSAQLSAASEELGLLLEEEFATTQRAQLIYDFGEFTYRNEKKKVSLNHKTLAESGEASLAAANELSLAARKAAGVRFGAALTKPDAEGRRWISVAEKNQTYVRQMQSGESARAGALAVLDLVRRLSVKQEDAANSTAAPVRLKAKKKANKFAIAATAAALAFSALTAGGLYYLYDKYYVPAAPDEYIMQAYK